MEKQEIKTLKFWSKGKIILSTVSLAIGIIASIWAFTIFVLDTRYMPYTKAEKRIVEIATLNNFVTREEMRGERQEAVEREADRIIELLDVKIQNLKETMNTIMLAMGKVTETINQILRDM